jgi:hypothetical protein
MEQSRLNLYAGLLAIPLAVIQAIVIHVPINWEQVFGYAFLAAVLMVIVISSLISPPQQRTRRSAPERGKGEVSPFK